MAEGIIHQILLAIWILSWMLDYFPGLFSITRQAIKQSLQKAKKGFKYKWMSHATKPHNYNAFMFVITNAFMLVLCKCSKFRIESNSSVFDSIRNEHNYSKFLNTYRHRFLTYLTE